MSAARSLPRATALLWDIGNTLVRWDPKRLYKTLIEDPNAVEDFLNGVCTMDWHTYHDRGVTMADNRAALVVRHPDKEALIRAWDVRWLEMFDGTMPGVLELFETLDAAGVPQYALTNMPAEKWPAVMGIYPFTQKLLHTVVSGEEGLVKPDPKIYELTKKRIASKPGETLFVDDRQDNVDAAIRCGFQAVRFVDAETLRKDMQERGLPV
ncbi:HAD family hydrolase [Woodsholea maritima]|uniref:HAD family hydrolase n=1 Tax=Woodsholea maritima TaxID=240237 RepID=UPI00036F2754|nr:HAD family phosphatase [Woodsholea maritima]